MSQISHPIDPKRTTPIPDASSLASCSSVRGIAPIMEVAFEDMDNNDVKSLFGPLGIPHPQMGSRQAVQYNQRIRDWIAKDPTYRCPLVRTLIETQRDTPGGPPSAQARAKKRAARAVAATPKEFIACVWNAQKQRMVMHNDRVTKIPSSDSPERGSEAIYMSAVYLQEPPAACEAVAQSQNDAVPIVGPSQTHFTTVVEMDAIMRDHQNARLQTQMPPQIPQIPEQCTQAIPMRTVHAQAAPMLAVPTIAAHVAEFPNPSVHNKRRHEQLAHIDPHMQPPASVRRESYGINRPQFIPTQQLIRPNKVHKPQFVPALRPTPSAAFQMDPAGDISRMNFKRIGKIDIRSAMEATHSRDRNRWHLSNAHDASYSNYI